MNFVRDFLCPNCGQRLAFENSRCLSCGNRIGFDLDLIEFAVLGAEPPAGLKGATGSTEAKAETRPPKVMCANVYLAGCKWLVDDDARGNLCRSCALTRTRPADSDLAALPDFAAAEAAKRRLVVELTELRLPIKGRAVDPVGGLCFDLLSSQHSPVITGHDNGVITLDLAESNDAHREQLRISMAEPYRTLLGHFRHESGHYYFTVLAESGPGRAEFERLFGDPDLDYQAELDRHYSQGAPAGWERTFVSAYATMHPAEDWAETFAHYLHIRDTIDTAAAFGFAPAGATLDRQLAGDTGFDRMVEPWLPLSWALNMINRSMGHADLYPFVLEPAALEKMRLVHQLVGAAHA